MSRRTTTPPASTSGEDRADARAALPSVLADDVLDVVVVGVGTYSGTVCVGATAVEPELLELEPLEPLPMRPPNSPPELLELPPPRSPRSGSNGLPADVPLNGLDGPPGALGIIPSTGPIKDASSAPPKRAAILLTTNI